MGVSTDAILFYGYCWSEENELDLGVSDEWTETVLVRRGMVDPWKSYPDKEVWATPYPESRRVADKWCADNRAALDAWSDAKKAVEGEFGVEVDNHCSNECPMPYIAASRSITLASRGFPEKVSDLIIGPTWDADLNRFMKEFRLKKPHKKPQWWLVSYWG